MFKRLSAGYMCLFLGMAPLVIQQLEVPLLAQAKPAVATPLVKELQGKPAIVEIYADWCPFCKAAAPTLSALHEEYKGRVNFIDLNITDRSQVQQSVLKAKQLGLESFFEINRAAPGTLAIINPATGEILQLFRGNDNKGEYIASIEAILTQLKK
jgi:thiol-disulfide isomerase/thioredoxin